MKQILLFTLACLFITGLAAQSQGPKSGTIFSTATLAGSSASWSNVANVAASDNNYASFGNIAANGGYTNYLVVTGFNFNVLPANNITGISVEIESSDNSLLTSEYSIRIVKDNTIVGTDKSTGAALTAGDSYKTYGGNGDLWGQTFNYKDLSDPGFGVAIALRRNAAGGITAGQIDHIRITLHSPVRMGTLPVKLLSFNATKNNNNSVQVKWNTAEESSIDKYEIERSSNGRDFTTIGVVNSANNSNANSYAFTDNAPLKGGSWYRLRIIEQTGSIKNSSIAAIRIDETGKNSLYPTLVAAGQTISISNAGTEQLNVQLYNTNGQLVANNNTSTGQLNASIKSSGTLYYKIADSKGAITGSGKIIIQ